MRFPSMVSRSTSVPVGAADVTAAAAAGAPNPFSEGGVRGFLEMNGFYQKNVVKFGVIWGYHFGKPLRFCRCGIYG